MNYLSIPGRSNILKSSILIIVTWLLLAIPSKAQPNFQEGIIVTQKGDSLSGFIDNREWIENPESIRFKRDSLSKVQTFTVSELKAFYFSDERYISARVTIDKTPRKGVQVMENESPSNREDTVFLTVLVEGPISLYYYRDFRDHFFIKDSKNIEELIAQKYIVKKDGKSLIATVERFRDQLKHLASKCPDTNSNEINYSKKSLIGFLANCNESIKSGSVQYVHKIERASFSSQVLAGLSSTYYGLRFGKSSVDFGSSNNFTIGLSALITLPRSQSKRLIFADLQLYRFESNNIEPYTNRYERYTCVNSQCAGFTFDEYIDNMHIEINYLKLSLGYRQKFRSGRFSPFVDLGLSISKRLHHQTQADFDIREYSYQGNGAPRDEELVLEDSFIGNDEITTLGSFSGGVIGGMGTGLGPFDINLRGELNYISNKFSIIKSLSLLLRYNVLR